MITELLIEKYLKEIEDIKNMTSKDSYVEGIKRVEHLKGLIKNLELLHSAGMVAIEVRYYSPEQYHDDLSKDVPKILDGLTDEQKAIYREEYNSKERFNEYD